MCDPYPESTSLWFIQVLHGSIPKLFNAGHRGSNLPSWPSRVRCCTMRPLGERTRPSSASARPQGFGFLCKAGKKRCWFCGAKNRSRLAQLQAWRWIKRSYSIRSILFLWIYNDLYMPFQMFNFWSSRLQRPRPPVGRSGNSSRPPRPESKVLPRSASEVSGVNSCAAAGTLGYHGLPMDPQNGQNGCPFCIRLQFLKSYFLGDQKVWPLQWKNLRPSVYTFEMWKGYLWFAGECDTVSEVEHPGLASWSLAAKKGQL